MSWVATEASRVWVDKEADIQPVGIKPAELSSPVIMAKLPTERQERKEAPIVRGCLDYFPLALMEVAKVSHAATQQHHPDKPMHWDKSKSTDEADCLVRHLLERGTFDTDGQRHSAKVAWRALALLQRELEGEKP